VTADDLEKFRQRMGWSIRETCRQLDISQDRYRRFMDEQDIPRHIELACAALECKKARE